MSDQPFRFLHSADFQLDQPLYGLTEIPDPLRSALMDGAYRAAERVFDTAISEKVGFVCLTGDLLNLAHPTARSISFLRDQFERLDEQGITVYWSGRHQDGAHHWPALIPLPASIHHFGPSAVETITHTAPAGFAVDVLGQSGAREVSVAEFCGMRAAATRSLSRRAKRTVGCWPHGASTIGRWVVKPTARRCSPSRVWRTIRARRRVVVRSALALTVAPWSRCIHRAIPACGLCRVMSSAGSTNGS